MGVGGGAGIVGPVQEIWLWLGPSLASVLEAGVVEEQRPSLFGRTVRDCEEIMNMKAPFLG